MTKATFGSRTLHGSKVVDARAQMTVYISKQDVERASLKDPSHCAAARALSRQQGCSEAIVHLSRTYVKRGRVWVRYRTPGTVRSELVAFDRGGSFEPGDYTFETMGAAGFEMRRKHYAETGRHPNKGVRHKGQVIKNVRPHGATEWRT